MLAQAARTCYANGCMERERPYVTERELRVVDRVLDTSSGYVLDFSNRTFAHFFDDFGVDIDDKRYEAGGTSKANRLRTFLRITPPPLTGQVLQALLERRFETPPDSPEVRSYCEIAERLSADAAVPVPPRVPPPSPPRVSSTPPAPSLRSRLTGGEHPTFDSKGAPWNGPLPDIEPGVPEVLHDAARAGIDVLLLTAVPVERDAVLRLMKPLPGRARIASAPHGHLTYHVGTIGDARVALTMSRPGAIGRDASILTLHEAIQTCAPRSVIAVGIAFGGYTDKLKMADVLVSNRIASYEPMRKQAAGDRPRGSLFEPGPLLLNRFRNIIGWRFERPDGLPCGHAEGQLLSGEKLVDELDYKEELFTHYPESVGGEMEGAGVAAAAEKSKVEWIVVKAVCDWGDGTKGDDYQPLAAAAAASLVAHVISPKAALADLPRKTAAHASPAAATARPAAAPITSPALTPPPTAAKPFRWTPASLGNVYHLRTETNARQVRRRTDERDAKAGEPAFPRTRRVVEVFPGSVPIEAIAPASLARLVESSELVLRGHDVFPFCFHHTKGVTLGPGRAWPYPAEVRRDFAVGFDGSTLYREGLWEDRLPPQPPIRIGNELGACHTAERAIGAVRFIQKLLQHFSVRPERYEIIVRLEGVDGKRLYCDAHEPLRTLFPLVATESCAEDDVIVGATFVPDLTDDEIFEMVAKLVEQIATVFNAPSMANDIMPQVKKNLG